MVVKKREYLLRGGPVYNTITDEELYQMKLSLKDTIPDFYEYYLKRENLYTQIGLGKPNSYQRYWMYWRFKGKSVITSGPVGIGKTTFSMVEALLNDGRTIIVVPTRALAESIYKRINDMMKQSDIVKNILVYDRKYKSEIVEGEFDIAILTSQAFRVIYPQLQWKSDLSIVDDVDAFVKNPKNLDRLMDITQGGVILSSATFKVSPRQRQRLIEEFGLSFKRSNFVGYRNIADIYDRASTEEELFEKVAKCVKMCGHGGIIFLPRGADEKKLIDYLQKRDIKVALGEAENLALLGSGQVDALVGKAAFYGTLVRGIDMPDVIRYTVFAGVPRGEIVIKKDSDITRWWKTFIGGKVPSEWKEIVEKIKQVAPSKMWSVCEEEDRIVVVYPDITTYIQASGRTSRFTGSGFTFGISLLIDTDENLLISFLRKAIVYGLSFEYIDNVDLAQLVVKTVRSRENTDSKVDFKSILMLVESPHKVDTISSLLGGGVVRYIHSGGWIVKVAEVSFGTRLIIIAATVGHTTDIVEMSPTNWPHNTLYGVSIEEKGFYPIMDTIKMIGESQGVVIPDDVENIRDKLDIIRVYRNISSVVDEVWVATDPDSEGERIAYEVGAYLFPFASSVARIEFREITRKALMKAIDNIRDINTYRVEAALTRRIEDRWVGFYLSQKVSRALNNKGLSAGRVQSPVLGWIIHRYRLSREQKKVYRVRVDFIKDFYVESDTKPDIPLIVESVVVEDREKHPLPPYSTDSLLADASRILGFKSFYTMKLAQDLFEGGFITYHRTDSVRVSEDGIKVARMYLEDKKDLLSPRYWNISTSPSVGGAHECIRPTKPIDVYQFWDLQKGRGQYTADHGKLYSLIFRRFIASQMIPAVLQILLLGWKDWQTWEVAMGIKMEGYLSMYRDVKVFDVKLPSVGDVVIPDIEELTRPLAFPMKEEEVIRQMKEKSIGRPSTYGKIIEIIKKRKYIKVSPKGFLIPTALGIKVWDYLKQHFESFVSEERTALLYQKMDNIESGSADYMEVLREIFEELGIYGD